jgi:pimeloyl-ACP methyl ester carboxylesterase
MLRSLIIAASWLFCAGVTSAFAQSAPPVASVSVGPASFPTATMGGVQFWSDELVFRDWRIQRNVYTGHHRLLDGRDFRRAWGTFDECQSRLSELQRELDLQQMKGRAVVTLHGLGRSRDAMNGLGDYLSDKCDCTWINVTYASSRR